MTTVVNIDRYDSPLRREQRREAKEALLLSAYLAKSLKEGIGAAQGNGGKHPQSMEELIGLLAQMIGEYQIQSIDRSNDKLRAEIAIGQRVNQDQEAAFKKQQDAIAKQKRKSKQRKWGFCKNMGKAWIHIHALPTKKNAQVVGNDMENAMADQQTMQVLSYAMLIGTCIACPALAPVAIALFALEESGEMDKMCDKVAGKNHWARLAFKVAVILSISAVGAGAGYATTRAAGMTAEREAAAQAAREAAAEESAKESAAIGTKSSASAASRFTASNAAMSGAMAAGATHPIVEFAQACGLKNKDALFILGICESLMWIAAGMGAGVKSAEAISESGAASSGYIRMQVAAQEMLATPMLIGGLMQAFFQTGQGLAKEEQAATQKVLAKLSAEIDLMKNTFTQASDGLKQVQEEMKTNLRSIHAMMDTLPDLLEPAREAARVLTN